jgi:hypothetical protein
MLATTVLWLLGYSAGALPLLLIFGGYFVAVARPFWEVLLCSVVAVSCFAVLWWGGGAPYGAQEFFISVLAIGLTLGLGRAGRLRVDLANARAEAARKRRRDSPARNGYGSHGSCTTSSAIPSARSRCRPASADT